MSAEKYLNLLNSYFECAAGAVLADGGEVLTFIGGGVFAVFPITIDPSIAASAQLAINACAEARIRLKKVNILRFEKGDDKLEFGLGVRLGDLMYGNIGVSERFGVHGNRISKSLGKPYENTRCSRSRINRICKHIRVAVEESRDIRSIGR